MGDAATDRANAAALNEGDVIKILLTQHAQIRDLCQKVTASSGSEKKDAFDALRALLAVHETAEELVLRPVTEKIALPGVADARNHEEAEANGVLKTLEGLEVESAAFDEMFRSFVAAVDEHAEAEEHDEFPAVLATCSEEERQKMGTKVKAAEATAPTHPHPSVEPSSTTQKVVGPFAAIVDRAKDAIAKVS